MQQVAPAQIDLFATRFNNKLPLFASPVPDPLASTVDTFSLPWVDLHPDDRGVDHVCVCDPPGDESVTVRCVKECVLVLWLAVCHNGRSKL